MLGKRGVTLTTLHHIMNLGPRRHHRTTERVDNTYVPSSVAPSEFSSLYVSRVRPGPAESFSQRMSAPITRILVSIFELRN